MKSNVLLKWEEYERDIRSATQRSEPLLLNVPRCGDTCSGGSSPVSHHGGPDTIPGPSMWNLCWTKWHWDRFFPEYFGFTLSVSFHRCSITRKNKKKLIIFITGLHNKPHGCGASVASAAGLLTKMATLCAQCDCYIQRSERPVQGNYSCLPSGSLLVVLVYIHGHLVYHRPRRRPVVLGV